MAQTSRLNELHLSTLGLPFEQMGPAWRHMVNVLFDVSCSPSQDFEVSLHVYNFNQFLLFNGCPAACRYRRDCLRLARCDVDHYLLHVPLEGGVVAGNGMRARPGDVVLLDLTQPADFRLKTGQGMTLLMPRSILPEADDGRLHGVLLRRDSASSHLLAGVLASLATAAPQLTQGEGASFSQPLLALVAACLAHEAVARQAVPRGAMPGLARRARLYIEDNLHRDDLTPTLLAKALGTSRSQLYRLFEHSGGVHRYLMQRRLRRCLLALGDSRNAGQRIGELAYAHGFADEAHFSKAFRKAFGLSPGAARTALLGGSSFMPVMAQSPTLAHWVSELVGQQARGTP